MTPADLERLQPPPRPLPASLRAYVVLRHAEGAFLWIIIAALIGWLVTANADVKSLLFEWGPLSSTTVGRVVSISELFWRQGRGRSSSPVYRVEYEFQGPDGVLRRGRSWGSDPAGKPLIVEWPARWPEASRIQGMRGAPFEPGILMTLIFPGAALLMARAILKEAASIAALLEEGHLDRTRGALIRQSDPARPLTPDDFPAGVFVDPTGALALDRESRLLRPSVWALIALAVNVAGAWLRFAG